MFTLNLRHKGWVSEEIGTHQPFLQQSSCNRKDPCIYDMCSFPGRKCQSNDEIIPIQYCYCQHGITEMMKYSIKEISLSKKRLFHIPNTSTEPTNFVLLILRYSGLCSLSISCISWCGNNCNGFNWSCWKLLLIHT